MVSIDHFFQMCLFQKLPSEEWLKNHSCLKIEDHKELPNADTKLVQVDPYLEIHFGSVFTEYLMCKQYLYHQKRLMRDNKV